MKHNLLDTGDEAYSLKIDDMTWRILPNERGKRYGCALVPHGRHVYAFGGAHINDP